MRSFTLAESVYRILGIVDSDARLSGHREECESLWKEAISADEVRSLLSVAFTRENGLVVPVMPPDGRASEITDPKELRALNDHTVQLAKKLAALLDELLAQRG